jgi:hypothetical protein
VGQQGSVLWSQFWCDFRQFLAKMINFLNFLALFRVKNAFFRQFFRRK